MSNVQPWMIKGDIPLFCCNVAVEPDGDRSVVSGSYSVAGILLGADHWYDRFICPECGRTWSYEHDHDTGSGMDHDWFPARIFLKGENYKPPYSDTLCDVLYAHHALVYRTTEGSSCEVPAP